MTQQFFDLLKSRIRTPINLLDVGGAGGVIEGWQRFDDKARVYCFEARDDEAADLTASNTLGNIEYVPIALSNDDRGIELTVTVNRGCSSMYPPVERIYQRYPGCAIMRPVAHASCPSTTVDAFVASRGIGRIHGIKLDTQGSELNILRGGEKALDGCLFLIVEAEFNTLYEGQPLFCDVDRFLRDRGFVLWRLGNLAHYSTGVVGGEPHAMMIGSDPGGHQMIPFANGQLFWGDAFYVRAAATPVSSEALSVDDAIAGAALVSQYRFWDLALEMIRKSGDQELLKEAQALLSSSFVASTPDQLAADQFQSLVRAKTDQSSWEVDFDVEHSCIVYGPYIRLPQGSHEVVFHVEPVDFTDQEIRSPILFDVAQDMVRQNSIELVGRQGAQSLRAGAIKLSFYNDSPTSTFEFRIYTNERPYEGSMLFKGVSLSKSPSSD